MSDDVEEPVDVGLVLDRAAFVWFALRAEGRAERLAERIEYSTVRED